VALVLALLPAQTEDVKVSSPSIAMQRRVDVESGNELKHYQNVVKQQITFPVVSLVRFAFDPNTSLP